MNLRTLLALAAVALVVPAATATASTKSEKAQNAQIKKLTHDLKVVSAREKALAADYMYFIGCLSTYNLTWYGDVNETGTDGYTYVNQAGETFQFTAMAPTYDGDTPSGTFLTIGCGEGRAARSVRSRMHSGLPIGKPTPAHRR